MWHSVRIYLLFQVETVAFPGGDYLCNMKLTPRYCFASGVYRPDSSEDTIFVFGAPWCEGKVYEVRRRWVSCCHAFLLSCTCKRSSVTEYTSLRRSGVTPIVTPTLGSFGLLTLFLKQIWSHIHKFSGLSDIYNLTSVPMTNTESTNAWD